MESADAGRHLLDAREALAWDELERRGSIRSRYLRSLKEETAVELARCLDPFVHEQSIRPYGAMVCRQMPHLDHLGRLLDTTGLPPDVVHSLADGRHSLLLVVKGQSPRLLVLHERVDTDQDYASRAVWLEGLILAVDDRGVVRIVTDSSVTLIEGRRWIAKDLVFEAAEDIGQVVPVARLDVVHRLLELCHHRISPAKRGATLIYQLDDGQVADRRRDAGVPLDPLRLSVLNPADEPLILHQVRYRDGAVIIGHDGGVLAVNVMLQPSRTSEQTVPAHGGTRHTSASRHTHDRPDVLAFVVSADGPVTVFSDGKRVADLKMGDPQTPPYDATSRVDLDDRTCGQCGVLLTIRTVSVAGFDADREVRCPACGELAAGVQSWHTEVFLRKTTQTIGALRALRGKRSGLEPSAPLAPATR